MSRSGEITLAFGAEERRFRLIVGGWRAIQERCDAGPPELLARMAPMFEATRRGIGFGQLAAAGLLGRWRVDDIREPLYQGLIGGGMTPTDAGTLIRALVDERPLGEALPIAYQVVMAGFVGAEDEQAVGEPVGEASEVADPLSRPSPEESSASATKAFTPKAARSGGRRAKSTTSPSGSFTPR